ncbi:glycosyltransferase [Peribacillus loiseleuriae]|uniref:Glycosyltransferase 2-like domain-containing protein n=1 Tax=Peribacillus loiseleuriae TaxID=1679170 RepID=A0A0K9GWP9_9BACI|nr:glycosyltransferase [Peribacillus loiseleuriae]KMY51041.1 hypothetical protein AC625_17150 [Peribacillus loiseleuriae]
MKLVKDEKLYVEHKPEKSNICAVIVTFNPDLNIPDRVNAIKEQVMEVVIVDNGSENLEWIEEITKDSSVKVICNKQNLGIATALNQGAYYANENRYKWLLTLDQDTFVNSYLVENHIQTFIKHTTQKDLALLGTNYQDKNINKQSIYQIDSKLNWIEIDEVICSGSLMYIPIFLNLGCFREELFIDQVDNEYCIRLKSKGYKIAMSSYIGMVHSMGEITSRNFFNKTIYVYNQSSLRSYYRTRNCLILFRENILKNPKWALKKLISVIKDYTKVILFEDNKFSKVKFMILGFYHALTKTTGKL